jgi:hypothetical protein
MMKRLLLATLVGVFCFSGNLNAANPYQSLRNRVVGFGQTIDNINIPLVGKILPVAMVAACFKECPGQTMVVLAGLLAYALLQNESVCSALNKYIPIGSIVGQGNNQTNATDSDENIFVFDGQDDEYAEDQEETEDEMLGIGLLDEEHNEQDTHRKHAEPSTLKFL